MTKLKLLAAAAVLSTAIASPAMAQQVDHPHHVYHHRGPVGAAADTAADVAGAAVGTAAAIATTPFRNSYNYNYYEDQRNFGPEGFACHHGTWFKGDDGRRHICQ
jgi:hypothetical protein